jgi:peptidoglycan/LPS O-acetylase OafA/YrhL
MGAERLGDRAVGHVRRPTTVSVGGSGNSLSHAPALDGLRALALLAVLYHHWVDSAVRVSPGTIGVRLFFVVSGFLITRILLVSRFERDGTLGDKLKTFYIRRTLRIFPLYYAVLLVSLATSPSFRDLWLWYVAYLQNLRMMAAGTFLFAAHFWTLAIEEQFYLLWPVLIFTVPRRAIGPMIAGAIALSPLWRIVALTSGRFNAVQIDLFTLGAFDALGLGALLAWYSVEGRPLSGRKLSLAGAGGMILVVLHGLLDSPFVDVVLFDSGVALASFALIGAAVGGHLPKLTAILSTRPLTSLGKISYGVYVYHAFFPNKLGALGPYLDALGGRALLLLASLVATLLISSLSWRFFERPINDLKDRLAPGRPARNAPAEPPRNLTWSPAKGT